MGCGPVKPTEEKGKDVVKSPVKDEKVDKGPPIQPIPPSSWIEAKNEYTDCGKADYGETKGRPETLKEEKKVKQEVPDSVKFGGISDAAKVENGVSNGNEAVGRNEGATGNVENDNDDFTDIEIAKMAAKRIFYKDIIFADKVQKLTTENDLVNSTYAKLGPYSYKTLPQGGSRLVLLPDVLIMDGNQYYGFMNSETGHRDGKGVMIWPDGLRYDGCWKDNKITGQGRGICPHGDVYEGELLNDKRHGKGKYLQNDGQVYEGDWADNAQNGYGVMAWPNGERYEGSYVNGKKHGTGTYRWASGASYHGEYHEGKQQGKGIYKFVNGGVYDGEWLNDNMHGHGDFKWPSGARYVGEFVNDLKEGQGIYEWPDGTKYDGQWLKDKRHGIGHYTIRGGKPRLGAWKDDKRLRWLDEQPDA